jgi:ubiquinol-cytochrome c reductase cytochrome b subunit
VLGSAVIPGGILLMLGALPYFDKSPERHPAKRKWVMTLAAALIVVVTVLSVMGYIEHFVQSAHG